MTASAQCPRCGQPVEAEDGNGLVEQIRAHVRDDHGLDHELPRTHIAAMLAKQGIDIDVGQLGNDLPPQP